MNLLRYKPLFRWAVPIAILLTLAAGAIIATRVVWAGDGILGPNGRRITVYNFDYGYGTCTTNPNATLIDDYYPRTEDWYAFQVPSNVAFSMCRFEITDPDLVPDSTYVNFGWLCETGLGDTYFSKAIVNQNGTITIMCFYNSSPNAYPPGPDEGQYNAPTFDLPGVNDDPYTGGSTGDGDNAGVGDPGGDATGDTSGNTVDGAGATLEPQSGETGGGDNNNGAPPDHAGPQDNGNGNAPDHAGPQDNHDGIDKDNGNGGGNGNGGN